MLDLPISSLPLVFLDTETTGLNPRTGDRVVEIALARFRGEVMENYFVSLVSPQRRIPREVSRIHGITDADVRAAPTFAQIVPQLRAELGDAVVVAHNALFDLGFVINEFRLARETHPDNLVLDTLILLRTYFQFPSNSLPNVAQRLGIQTQNAHRALGDALTTREVFAFIVNQLGARARTLGELLELQGGAIRWPQRDAQDTLLPPALQDALNQNRKLFLRYADNFGEQSERWVSPLDVYFQRDVIYLRAYCHLRNGERQFRLDRVIEMRVEE